jgi:hypothetical protein
MLRGVQFSGPDFDMLEPDAQTPKAALEQFTVNFADALCACSFDTEIDVLVLVGDNLRSRPLRWHGVLPQLQGRVVSRPC